MIDPGHFRFRSDKYAIYTGCRLCSEEVSCIIFSLLLFITHHIDLEFSVVFRSRCYAYYMCSLISGIGKFGLANTEIIFI